MSTALDELAGPATRREIHLRALPLLRLAAAEDVDVDSLFGDVGEAIILSAAEHLTHPSSRAIDFMHHFGRLREAVRRFEAWQDGTCDDVLVTWTEDEVAAEVLYPLSWLLNGADACKACFHTASNVAMIRGQLPGEVACAPCIKKFCTPCLKMGSAPKLAVIVTGGNGFCGPCADRAPIATWPARLTALTGGAA